MTRRKSKHMTFSQRYGFLIATVLAVTIASAGLIL